MSIATCFKRTNVRRIPARSCFLQSGLLLAGALLAFGVLNAAANDAPSIRGGNPFMEFFAHPKNADVVPLLAPAGSATLSPRMQGALDYVEERYDVSPRAMRPVFEAAQRFGNERSIDPLLIVAVIAVESSFNPKARSPMGAHGLMQVIPRYHMDKLPKGHGKKALMNPIINVKVGTQILDEYISRHGSVVAGLQSYNGSSDRKHRYAKKVLGEKARLEVAARQYSAKSRHSNT